MTLLNTSAHTGPVSTGTDATGVRPTAPRRPRRSRQELRELVLAAGKDLVHREGLGTAADHVTFTRVFERVEAAEGVRVTHSSVIGRIWPNIDAYRLDVLKAAGASDVYDVWPDVARRVGGLLGDMDRSTPESRAEALAELCRIAGVVTLTSCLSSEEWRNQLCIWILAFTSPPGGTLDPVRGAIADHYMDIAARAGAVYQGLADYLGYRLRPEATLDEFALTVNALIDGCAGQVLSDPAAIGEVMLPGPGGEQVPWTYFALGVQSLVVGFFEPDPGWTLDGGPDLAPGAGS